MSKLESLNSILQRYLKYFRSTFHYLAASVISAGVMILINPLLAQKLDPTDYAVIGYYNSFNVIFLCIINLSLTFFYGPYYFKVKEDSRQEFVDTVLTSLCVFGIVVSILVSLLFYTYHTIMGVSFDFIPYALLTIASVYFQNFYTIYQINARVRKESFSFITMSLFQTILGAGLAILLVYFFDLGSFGRMMATLGAYAVVGIISLMKILKRFTINYVMLKEMLSYSWPLSVSGLLWFFFNGVDTVLLEEINDKEQFGYYSVGLAISGYLVFFYTAISSTYEPDIFEAINVKNWPKVLKLTLLIFGLNLLPNVIFIFWASEIIGLLTSNRYLPSTEFAQIFAIKNITMAIYNILILIYSGYGLTKFDLLIRIIGSFICYFLFQYAIRQFGFHGAAWGQVLAFLLMSLIAFFVLYFKISSVKIKI